MSNNAEQLPQLPEPDYRDRFEQPLGPFFTDQELGEMYWQSGELYEEGERLWR